GQLVSTGRGIAGGIGDLARWATRSGTLRGRVGLVGAQSQHDQIAAGAAVLQSLGINLVAQAFLDDGSTASHADVAQSVLSFSQDGVSVVLFVAPVSLQSAWAATAATL